MESDLELLRRFAATGDAEAFAALVHRHSAMVRGVALRRTEDSALAEEVAQTVFAILARKAARLSHENVAGWLHQAACLESKAAVRKAARYRSLLGQYSHHMNASHASHASDSGSWEEVRPHLDEALSCLREDERNLVVLHYLEKRPVRDLAAATGRTEQASRKKLQRAILGLRRALERRGVRISPAALAPLLAAQPLGSPSASAAVLAASALKAAPALQTHVFLAHSLSLMNATTAAAVLVLAAIPVTILWRKNADLQMQVSHLSQQLAKPSAPAPLAPPPPLEQAAASEKPPETHLPQGASGWSGRLGEALIEDLKNPEWKIRRGAAATLRGSNVPAALAVPALHDTLGDAEWQVRKAVAEALAYYGGEAAEAVPGLVKALTDEEWQVRMPAAEALAAIGGGAREAAPELAAALRDEEWQVRNAAAMALAAIPPMNADAVPMLTAVLNDEEWHVAANASMALGALGTSAEPAVPALSAALEHPEAQVRLAAAYALGLIGQPTSEAVRGLKGLAHDNDMRVRQQAAGSLAKLGASGVQ